MSKFKDNMGQQWSLSLTIGKVRQLRDSLGFDLLNPNDHMQVISSLTERITFAFLLCEEQAKKLEVDADAFEVRLHGDGFMEAASDAFLEELDAFCQRVGQTALAKLTRNTLEQQKAGRVRLQEMLNSGQIDSLLEEVNQSFTTLLSQESTGTPSSDSQQSQE